MCDFHAMQVNSGKVSATVCVHLVAFFPSCLLTTYQFQLYAALETQFYFLLKHEKILKVDYILPDAEQILMYSISRRRD